MENAIIEQLAGVREIWTRWDVVSSELTNFNDIHLFEIEHKVKIPYDLFQYFLLLNGTRDEYDNNLIRFYSFKQFLPINKELVKFQGTPNYKNIVKTLVEHENCYVFADYSFHLSAYAIRLNKNDLGRNDIYLIQGSGYSIIANSFTDFMNLYLYDDSSLY